MSISSRIFRNMRSIEVTVVVIRAGIIGSSLATAADVKRIVRCSGGSIISAVAGQASFRRNRKPTIIRSVRFKPFSMAEWSLFHSENNEMCLVAITGIEETSSSIVMANGRDHVCGHFHTPVKVRWVGLQLCDRSSRLDRHQPVADGSVPDIGHPQCPNRLEP